jgi:AcrR family transcriptional regulator
MTLLRPLKVWTSMAVKDRRERQRTLLRQQILDAARELLVRDGYERLSMRRVAERIDYSPTAIYLHFKDKQDLVFSLCEETFAKLVRELETLPVEFPDPLVQLRKGMKRYIDFGLHHPDHYLPAFVLPPAPDMSPKRRKAMTSEESNGMKALGFLRNCIALGVKTKKLRKVDPDIAARSTWAALHGLTTLLIVHKEFPWGDREQVIDTLLDSLINGLRLS